MLFVGDDATGWVEDTDTANLAVNTTTYKAGGGSLEFDKTGATVPQGRIYRRLSIPIDIQYFRNLGATITWWAHHADWTDITGMLLTLAYEDNNAGGWTDYDIFEITSGLSAGWNKFGPTKLSAPTSSGGSPTDDQRTHCMKLGWTARVSSSAVTFSNVKVGPVIIDIAGSGSGGQPGLITLGNTRDRILLPPLDSFTRNPTINTKVNQAQDATEVVLIDVIENFQASLNNVRSKTTRENLRKFARYAMANNDWSFAHDSRQLVSTTVDAASGAGEAGPRVLNIADTSEVEFLFNDLGLSEVFLLVGPNSSLQSEIVRIPSSSHLSSGVSVTAGHDMHYTYASGDLVRSASTELEGNYYPTAALLGSNPNKVTSGSWSFDLKAREG